MPMQIPGIAGIFKIEAPITSIGGTTHQSVTGNSVAIIILMASILVESIELPENFIPQNKRITIKIAKEGPVVQHIALIWSKRDEPATAGARFVVSERGDILSPK